MPFETFLHVLLQPEGRFIPAPSLADQTAQPRPMNFGDKLPIRVFPWQRKPMTNKVSSLDLSPFYVELTVGQRNEKPSVGFFSIAFDGGDASTPIAISASALTVQTALSTVGVIVQGVPGSYVITSAAVGARSTPVLVFSGDVVADGLLTVISAGSATTFAQWRVEFPEAAPAIIGADEWTTGSTVASSSVAAISGTGNTVWKVIVDPRASAGFFSLGVNGSNSPFIPLGASPSELQDLIRTVPGASGAIVQAGETANASYIIGFAAATTLTINDAALTIAASLFGVLDLSGDGIRDLLGDSESVSALLTLSVYDATTGSLMTQAQTAVFVCMPVNRPTVFEVDDISQLASIDLPDMATGLWHTVALAGTNVAPTFEIGEGAARVDQDGPIFIADEEDPARSVYMIAIAEDTLQLFAVKAQGNPINASFQPRPFALRSPENPALHCPVQVTPPDAPAFADPGTLSIGAAA